MNGDKPAVKVSILGFVLVSLLIAATDILFVWINTRSDWEKLENSTKEEARHVQDAFYVALESLSTNMQAIATYVAANPKIAYLFYQGKQAVEKEGGGPGKAEAAKAREKLLQAIRPGWEAMYGRYEARQLHFHLGPGSISFLRAHRPEKFGDNMDEVRYTIVDANTYGKTTKGFETGRVYSGIRGVAPVWYILPESKEKIQVGAVEAGASFTTLLSSLHRAFSANFTVFLSQKHMQKNMWPAFLQRRYKATPPVAGFVLESANISKTKAYEFVDNIPVQNLLNADGTKILNINGHYLGISSFGFQDYKGKKNGLDSPVGKVLFWHDMSSEVADFHSTQYFNIAFALVAFILVEFLFFFSWRLASIKLRNLVRAKTRELIQVNEDLKQKVQERHKAEQKYKTIFDNAPIGIFQATADGKYLAANTELAQIYGYSSAEELLENVKTLHDDICLESEKLQEMLELLGSKEEVRGFEAMIQRKDGKKIWTSRSVRRFMAGEDLIIFDGFVRDITDHKKLEQLKEDIDRITRHDLKSPIAAIIAGCNLLEMTEELSPEQEEVLMLTKDHAYQALDMINRSLVLYKVEQGGYKLQLEEFNLCHLFERIRLTTKEIADMWGSWLEVKTNGSLITPDMDTDCQITADRGLCYSIFTNLIRNAFEATKEPSPIRVNINKQEQDIIVSIHNDTIVPLEIKDSFFEKFATYGKSGGTGLGTYSAKLMVEYHGGRIDLISEQGLGTILEVRLPAQPNLNNIMH